MSFLKKHLDFIRTMMNELNEVKDTFRQLVNEEFAFIKRKPLRIFFSVLCIFPALTVGYFFYLLSLVTILLYGTVRVVYTVLIQLATPSVPLSTIYSMNCISEMLFDVLSENSKELRIDKPNNLRDLMPVDDILPQSKNGLNYFRYIVHHPIDTEDSAVSVSDVKELLNLKLSQYLQAHYYNCTITYEGIPVLYVFRVAESSRHAHCYDICIMLVDSPEKVCYLRLLEQSGRTFTVPQQLNDKDFSL